MAQLTGLPVGLAGDTTKRSTTALNDLGAKGYDALGNEYTYVKAGAAIAQYDACRMNGSALGYDDVRPTSAAGQVVLGAAQNAFSSGDYGFLLTRGVGTCKVVAATAAGVALVPNGTAGTLALAAAADITFTSVVALVTGVAAGSGVFIK